MDQYNNFTVDDFLQDDDFIDWVKNPSTQKNETWNQWLSAHPNKTETIEQAKNIIEAFAFTTPAIPDQFYQQLKTRIDTSLAKEKNRTATVYKMPLWLKVAAAVIGLIVIGGILYLTQSSNDRFDTMATAFGQTKTFTLADGSEVILNANSTLKYKANWENDKREVWLNGEGFFKIKHIEPKGDAPLPFTVHAGTVNVQVLGTEFNVKDRDLTTEVVLTTGKVKLSLNEAGSQALIMKPKDMVSYNKENNFKIRQVDPALYTAWITHKYIFDKVPLQQICTNLQEYFGSAFIIQDKKMGTQELSGTLDLQDEAALIKTLQVLLGVNITKKDQQIIIHSK